MQPEAPGWFGRNWKWFVPVGCVTVLLLAVGVAAVIGYGVLGMYENSSLAVPKRDALAAAQASPAVKQALGEPMEMGFMMSGTISVNDDRGQADVSYPIHGPRGKGRVKLVGELEDGRWVYSVLEAQIQGQPAPIDLRPALPAPPTD